MSSVPPARKLICDAGCQVDSPALVDFGVGPDLTHLEVSLFPFRSVLDYHPPWPCYLIDVVDIFGAIQNVLWAMPTPLEFEVSMNQFHPEIVHEIDGPPLAYPIPP